jgi:hypothetical protein
MHLPPCQIAGAQPSADQRRRASVLKRAVLPKNAQASKCLRWVFNASSVKKRISAFQLYKTRVHTPLCKPTRLANGAALDIFKLPYS